MNRKNPSERQTNSINSDVHGDAMHELIENGDKL